MAASSSDARNDCLFNTFRSSCQFLGFLIDDLVSCDEEIPDYVYTASNELLAKVLSLTNSIYKLSRSPKIVSKEKLVDHGSSGLGSRNGPFAHEDLRSTSQSSSASNGLNNVASPKKTLHDPYSLGVKSKGGIVEHKPQDVRFRSTSQLSNTSNGSNKETSPFISFVKAATRNVTRPNFDEAKSALHTPAKDVPLNKRMTQTDNVEEKVKREKLTALKIPTATPTENKKSLKKKQSNQLVRKQFALTPNFCSFLSKLFDSPEPIYYCHLCDCLVISLKKWNKHNKTDKHATALQLNHPNVLVKCSRCPFVAFLDFEAVSKFFDIHIERIHPNEKVSPQILDSKKPSMDMSSLSETLPDSDKLTPSAKKQKKAINTAIVPSSSSEAVISTGADKEENLGEEYESAFCYILRVIREYFEEHRMKVSAGFCIPCQAALDSMYLWSEHVKLPEHLAACNGFSCQESTCLECSLTLLGPEEAIAEYLDYPLHQQLDSLFI